MASRICSAGLAAILVALMLAFLPSIASAQSLQFGAWTPGDPYDGNVNGAAALETATGRHVDIVNWYQNWGGGDWISSVQNHALNAATGGGRTPMITWEPWAPGAGTDQPRFRLSRIAAGEFDAYITTWALALKATGSPVHLRPMHEMNGDWYPWSGAVNANSPALYVQAWRRMVDIFRRLGATNVRFVWSPNNVDVPASNTMESYYPGTSYVDVLAVDGYNWGSGTPGHGGWQSFSSVFMGAYDRLKALGPQPIWIAEVGTSSDGGDKAAWIRDMFAQAGRMDRLQAIVWFNEDKERDWRAAPSPEIASAFRPSAGVDAPAGAPTARAQDAKAKLVLTVNGGTRAGRKAIVRWRATGASTVKRWHAYLDGRHVRRSSSTAPRVARIRVAQRGSHRWRVVGRDTRGRTVVSATRSFRVS
ncbi:MAG TPA: glycosyl hydrolase [Solirubrobacteraceae bacterium]|nr:glycosyl hydrolase [Solirubrobacteraceae bacterium]